MAKSGQITVTTAGTAERGTDVVGDEFFLKAHPSNTGVAWVGESGADVADTTGFPLEPGESVIVKVSNLNEIYFDVDVNGEIICWLRIW
jgi:phage-related tail protein